MSHPESEAPYRLPGGSGCRPSVRLLLAGLLVVGCATAPPPPFKPELVRSHVYPLPLDNVLAQAARSLQKKGWVVRRVGNVLLTNWQGTETGLVTYRLFGERVDAGLCSVRVERLVASRSTGFNTDHPVTESAMGRSVLSVNPEFVADSSDKTAAGAAPPPGSFSPSDMARPSAYVVTEDRRDPKLELELQKEIDPTPVLPAEAKESPSAVGSTAAGGDSTPRASVEEPGAPLRRDASPASPGLSKLAGIWEGTFSFKGNMTGSYSGEIAVAVEDGSAEVTDFCPDRGGTLKAMASREAASWQGDLACPPIAIKGCTSSVIHYNSARATLNGSTLVLVAAGDVETPLTCGYTSGALSVAFVAQKADYVHIAVTRVKKATSCEWPSDWEDFNSLGSMAMPDTPEDEAVYLGIIRAKGSRLGEIERLLRHCHQVVRLHGEPVLMRLAATHPHHP
jgi:hypothetical protein